MNGFCGECGCECQARIVDDSYDHEFGTEVVIYVASECCEAPVYHDESLTDEITAPDIAEHDFDPPGDFDDFDDYQDEF